MINRSGADHQGGVAEATTVAEDHNLGTGRLDPTNRPLLALVEDPQTIDAARLVIDALRDERDSLVRELREARALIDQFEPFDTHLREFARLADSRPYYLVSVKYRRNVRFVGINAWTDARDFIKQTRHQQTDAILRRVFEEDPDDV